MNDAYHLLTQYMNEQNFLSLLDVYWTFGTVKQVIWRSSSKPYPVEQC